MRAAFKAEFLKQLRSKKWRQIAGAYYEPATCGRCALGVMLESAASLGLFGPEQPPPDESTPWWASDAFWTMSGDELRELVGLDRWQSVELLQMNDDRGMDFRSIAEIVELWPATDTD